jgi:hypothetical protein
VLATSLLTAYVVVLSLTWGPGVGSDRSH